MKTLHELATKLQTYIIKSQEDAHNATNMSVTKYNNLKLKMDTKYTFPNIIVCIGISEAVFNFVDGTKVDGGLGPDEKYVRKWLGSSNIVSDLKELWISTSELIKAEDEDKAISMEGEADEAKTDGPAHKKKRNHNNEEISLEDFLDMENDTEKPQEHKEFVSFAELEAEKEANENKNSAKNINDIKKDMNNYIKDLQQGS